MKQAGITKRGAGQSTATSLWGDSMSRDRRGPDTDSAGVAAWMDSVRRMADFSGTRRGAYPGRATAARACAGADAATAKDMSIGSGRAPTGARDEWRESRPNPVCDVACTDGKSRRGRRVVSVDDSRREDCPKIYARHATAQLVMRRTFAARSARRRNARLNGVHFTMFSRASLPRAASRDGAQTQRASFVAIAAL